jgi:hypothetical protein
MTTHKDPPVMSFQSRKKQGDDKRLTSINQNFSGPIHKNRQISVKSKYYSIGSSAQPFEPDKTFF